MSPILIPAGNPGAMTGGGNNTWLLTGAEPALIDAGVGAPSHVNAIASALEGRDLVTRACDTRACGSREWRARAESAVARGRTREVPASGGRVFRLRERFGGPP